MKLCSSTDLPTICSVCRQPPVAHAPDKRPQYVNFEAGYDGPVVGHNEAEGAQVYVENIVICEHCLAEAGRLIGLSPEKELVEHVTSLEAYCEQLEAGNREKDRAISNLNYTVSTLLDHPVKRPAGKPQFRGPDERKDELKSLSRRRQKTERIAKAKKG